MKRILKFTLALLAVTLLLAGGAAVWHVRSKLPQRSGSLPMSGLTAPVSVAYDERGVPHITAQNEADLYRALGYVHAQDRLFQMEMVRRLARGELAEILGPKLLEADRLFRTLGLRDHAEQYVARMDKNSPATQALMAYLDGINQYQKHRPRPLEFELLGIQPTPYTPVDTIAVSGYLAYSFAAAFRTEPVLTYVRDQLGAPYLKPFDLPWHTLGVVGPQAQTALQTSSAPRLQAHDWRALARLGEVSHEALALAGVPVFEGSNAWAVSGQRTASGKPVLAGDPHIAFASPAVWYEAHLKAPGFELYGHHQALNPVALLGHNTQFAWSLTMFQNDDVDLIAEKINPANPQQVWHQGQWADLSARKEVIAVKGTEPEILRVRRSPNGPIINDAFKDSLGSTPVAMRWTFLTTDNPLLDAFYELNRADTRDKARSASSKIHAPGLNVVWANAAGDIGWWAAARLPRRPQGVNPSFILDGSQPESELSGYHRFEDNPQEENPERGYIMSANHQPASRGSVSVPGYYNLPDRAQRLDKLLSNPQVKWTVQASQTLQLDTTTAYGPRVLKPIASELGSAITDPAQRALYNQLLQWDGSHEPQSIAPTVFNQFLYELVRLTLQDELGEVQFKNLLRTRALDHAVPRLTADAQSPWWDDRATEAVETRRDMVLRAWKAALDHLRSALGESVDAWAWGKAHTLTHGHPLGQQKPLNLIFNTGPFEAPGGRELPNNLSQPVGPAPWAVNYGPSTRRVIDFASPDKAVGINPVGQSGVWPDAHYRDQAEAYIRGGYLPMHLKPADVSAATRSTLQLMPK